MEKKHFLAAMSIKNAEGWNQTLNDWEFLFNDNPNLCLVALREGEIIATVTALSYENKLAWIGMMLVKKEYRGLGIGQMLMKSILEELKDYPCVKLDATPAGYPVYVKLGFAQEYSIYRMTRPGQNKLVTKDERDAIKAIQPEDLMAIVEFDNDIFGVERPAVLRYLYTQSPGIAWIIKNDHTIKGYIMGRPGSNYHQLGPLIAESSETSIALLSKALSCLEGVPVVVDILKDKEDVISWLHAQGFTQQRELIRMYYRDNLIQGNALQQFLISGPELG